MTSRLRGNERAKVKEKGEGAEPEQVIVTGGKTLDLGTGVDVLEAVHGGTWFGPRTCRTREGAM